MELVNKFKIVIDQMLIDKTLTFGWDEDIIDYEIVSFSTSQKNYVIKCTYIDDCRELVKYIEIDKNNI